MATKILVCVLVAAAMTVPPSQACTGFGLSGTDVALMAVNYDWDVPGGRLIINPRAVEKTALVGPDQTPAAWISKFGSITFNQYGREFPIGGINQVGLAMQVLWLDETQYPKTSQGPNLSALQWVQYSLDNLVTAQEVAESAGQFTISSAARLHFLACDRSRSCAVIEFIDGKPNIRAGRELPLPVLANSTYADSIDALNETLGYGGEVVKKAKTDTDSLNRFVTAAHERNALTFRNVDDAVDGAFAVLAKVAPENLNQWRVVYDLRMPGLHFITKGNAERRSLDIKDVDFHCLEAGVSALDLEADASGDIAGMFTAYTQEQNSALVRTSIGRTEFLSEMDDDQIDRLGSYPSSLVCTSKPRRPNPRGPADGPPTIAVE
jgi:choloylglycine hydrolase